MDIEKFSECLLKQQLSTTKIKEGIYGRITFYEPGTFEKYKHELYFADPSRRFVFLTGSDGLESLLGKSGFEIMLTVGKTKQAITQYIQQKGEFKLFIFEDEDYLVYPGTWDGISQLTEKLYPELRGKLVIHVETLKSTPLQNFEEQLGFVFKDIQGKSDIRFMTIEKLLASDMSTANVRLFFLLFIKIK